MPVIRRKGDILNSDCPFICHQVNCQGVMDTGIGKTVKDKWPEVYRSYIHRWKSNEANDDVDSPLLGQIQVINLDESETCVINMFSQKHFGYDGSRYTSYDAFWGCLWRIRSSLPRGARIGFPSRIGCGLGGGDWNLIQWMIEYVLGRDFDVEIWEFGDTHAFRVRESN